MIDRITITQMTIVLKTIYEFSVIPSKILMTFLPELGKTSLKFIQKHRRPQIAKPVLSRVMMEVPP